jgi:hypothetical protein
MNVVARRLTCALLVAPLTLTAQAVTSPRPGGAPLNLPPHIQAQLWPERQLSPVEQELKLHVTALGDSLTKVDATGAMIARQTRAGSSTGIVRSSARTLSGDCARVGRSVAPATTFAADLTTSDQKWGDPAVRAWRSGLAALSVQMTACERDATALVGGTPDGQRLHDVSLRASRAVADYRRTEEGLLRTLRMDVIPPRKSR